MISSQQIPRLLGIHWAQGFLVSCSPTLVSFLDGHLDNISTGESSLATSWETNPPLTGRFVGSWLPESWSFMDYENVQLILAMYEN